MLSGFDAFSPFGALLTDLLQRMDWLRSAAPSRQKRIAHQQDLKGRYAEGSHHLKEFQKVWKRRRFHERRQFRKDIKKFIPRGSVGNWVQGHLPPDCSICDEGEKKQRPSVLAFATKVARRHTTTASRNQGNKQSRFPSCQWPRRREEPEEEALSPFDDAVPSMMPTGEMEAGMMGAQTQEMQQVLQQLQQTNQMLAQMSNRVLTLENERARRVSIATDTVDELGPTGSGQGPSSSFNPGVSLVDTRVLNSTTEEAKIEELKHPIDEAEVLTVTDERMGCVFASVVAKGVNNHDINVVVEALKFGGQQTAIRMTHAENSTKALAEASAVKYGREIQHQTAPREFHASNGAAERAIFEVYRQVRTNVNALEARYKDHKLKVGSTAYSWLVRHSAWQLTRYLVPTNASKAACSKAGCHSTLDDPKRHTEACRKRFEEVTRNEQSTAQEKCKRLESDAETTGGNMPVGIFSEDVETGKTVLPEAGVALPLDKVKKARGREPDKMEEHQAEGEHHLERSTGETPQNCAQ
eukprot:s1171_g7.t2